MGSARPRQGDRVGDRRRRRPRRSRPAPDVHRRRRDPPQGTQGARRGVPQHARRPSRAKSGAASHVLFDDTYRDLASLTNLIQSADLVVLPYDSRDQVTSGVLVDAVAAGRPVVSTAFPHAVELLASGAGIVVPQRDPAALAAAIRSVLTDPAWPRRWRPKPGDWHPVCPGRPSRSATPGSPMASWPHRRTGGVMTAAVVRARAVDDRRHRDVRTRRPRHTAS